MDPNYYFGRISYCCYCKGDLQTRFKRLIGRRIRARKKEVKKYGIIKDVNLYDVVDEMKKEISRNVIGQEVAIQHLLDTF